MPALHEIEREWNHTMLGGYLVAFALSFLRLWVHIEALPRDLCPVTTQASRLVPHHGRLELLVAPHWV